MLNVLYDHQIFSNQRYGGVSRIFFELIRRMAVTENVDVSFFQGFFLNRYPLETLKKHFTFRWGGRAPYVPHLSVLLKMVNNTMFKWHQPVKKPQVYHPTNYARHASRWSDCPVVLTVCDIIPELFPDDFPDIRRRLRIKRECLLRADHIIAISESTRKGVMERYNIPGNKISVIYPGGPLITESSAVAAQSGRSTFRRSRPYILYVGSRKHRYKNFSGLLSAYAESGPVRDAADLLCFGGPKFNATEENNIKRLGIKNRVFHLSGDDDWLSAVYEAAAVFVYPSLHEGFGLPPLEAMAHGCPVIASGCSSIPEILGNAAEYFDPANPRDIGNTLERVLCNETARNRLTKLGRGQVQKYSWDIMTAETLNVYFSSTGQTV